MTPGTCPAARSFRATPLPRSVRTCAFSVAVAMFCSCLRKSLRFRSQRPSAFSTLRRLRPPYHTRRNGSYNPINLNPCQWLLLEQRADGLLRVCEPHSLGEQVAHGEHRQLLETPLLRDVDRVGHRHFLDRRIHESFTRLSGEQRMRRTDVDVLRADVL